MRSLALTAALLVAAGLDAHAQSAADPAAPPTPDEAATAAMTAAAAPTAAPKLYAPAPAVIVVPDGGLLRQVKGHIDWETTCPMPLPPFAAKSQVDLVAAKELWVGYRACALGQARRASAFLAKEVATDAEIWDALARTAEVAAP